MSARKTPETPPAGARPPAAPTDPQTRPEPEPAAPNQAEPPRARSLVRHLPRAGLVLFLLAIVIVFRSVLLPFVLAVFFAYLIYPVVWRIECIPIGRRHPPRWLAVISVYALLFFIGWWTIPPLFGNFADQVGKLLHDVPTLFEKLLAQRKRVDTAVARMLEVTSLSETTRVSLFADVDALAEGTLEPFEPPEGLELPPPPPLPESEKPVVDAAREPAAPTIVQLVGINVTFGARPVDASATPVPGAGEPPASAGTHAPAIAPVESPPTDASTNGESQDGAAEAMPAAPTRRFDEEKGAIFKNSLRDAIDAELEKPGRARGVAAKVEGEIIPELAKKELGLTADDGPLRTFARNCGGRVATAVRREEYADTINAYFESGVRSARAWVQDELKQVAGLATGLIAGLVSGIFDFFMVLMLTAFFLVFFPRVRDYMRDLVAPPYREDYAHVLKRIDTRLSGAIRGQVIICIVNAVLTFPGLWFIGAHSDATNLATYAVLLSVIAGVLSLIPIFGVILSTVPMVILALAQGSVWGSVLVIGWICVIHAVEAYLLNPNILGHSASMNPIIVVFALLAGKHVYGLVGALLAVPVASVLVSLFGYYRRLVAESGAAEEGVAAPADTWGD